MLSLPPAGTNEMGADENLQKLFLELSERRWWESGSFPLICARLSVTWAYMPTGGMVHKARTTGRGHGVVEFVP